jgi:hypothetical protein
MRQMPLTVPRLIRGWRRLGQVHGINPYVMFPTMMVKKASMSAQMSLQLTAVHETTFILEAGMRSVGAAVSDVLA